MKGLAIVAAVLMLAACKAKEANTVPPDSTAAPAMAPAPATDTGMAMTHDSTAAKDTTKH